MSRKGESWPKVTLAVRRPHFLMIPPLNAYFSTREYEKCASRNVREVLISTVRNDCILVTRDVAFPLWRLQLTSLLWRWTLQTLWLMSNIMAQGASIPSTVKWSLVATISTTETGDDGDTCGEPTWRRLQCSILRGKGILITTASLTLGVFLTRGQLWR